MAPLGEHQEAVGDLVRSRRVHALVSQDALAQRAGVPAVDLARLESGVVVGTAVLTSVLVALPSGEPAATGQPRTVLLSEVPRQRKDGVPHPTSL